MSSIAGNSSFTALNRRLSAVQSGQSRASATARASTHGVELVKPFFSQALYVF